MPDYNELFLLDSARKDITISVVGENTILTNADLYSEKFELYEGISPDSQLKFGECVASSVKFTTFYDVASLKGKTITISISINNETPYQVGTYKVFSDTPTADRRHRDIVAYDAMYDILNANVATWYAQYFQSNVTKTIKTFRDSFFSYMGITQKSVTLPNDSVAVEETIGGDEISGKTIVNAICEINGRFGHIARDGKFEYVKLQAITKGLYPSDTLYPGTSLYPSENANTKEIGRSYYYDVKYEDYEVKSITKLQIRQSENDIGVVYGSGDNMYIVEDNILVYGKDTTDLTPIAQTLYGEISGLFYTPIEVKAKGNLTVSVGDPIKITASNMTLYSYVLERTITGIQSLKDSYVSQGSEYQEENTNSMNRSIIQLKGKTNELERSIEETRSTITDVERGLQSQITQNAEQINLKVSNNEVVSAINLSPEQITISASKIDIQGVVTADYINTLGIVAGSVAAENITGNKISGKEFESNIVYSSSNATKTIISGGFVYCYGTSSSTGYRIEISPLYTTVFNSGTTFSARYGSTIELQNPTSTNLKTTISNQSFVSQTSTSKTTIEPGMVKVGHATTTSIYTQIDKNKITLSGSGAEITGGKTTGDTLKLTGYLVQVGDSTSYKVGFFGSSGHAKDSVSKISSPSSASTTAIASKVNELLDALISYGLV